jgi:predicted nucleotide-binding protein
MLDRADSLLSSLQSYVTDFWQNGESASTSLDVQAIGTPTTNEVFVVHGRDEGISNIVARFLEKLGLRPVLLAEQPGQGLTIIEKFQHHAQVHFAVVLLTPDDAGGLRGETDLRPRARQNVIFELGFFIGKLGRERVCALTKGKPKLDIPSDYAGVEYIPMDEASDWKMKLVGELKAAGLDVDANRVFGA